ncbi:TetR family transcriptional regulator [Pseudomonas aeruginosa]|nr:TetR family transcriptional regulator [Pseudomonas aeruginosa]
MRVSRAEAEANHQNVINVASRLFREHGFNGIGVGDLMKGAGLTQGGFYKKFDSKEDLMIQAARRAIEHCLSQWTETIGSGGEDSFEKLVAFYLSAKHCEELAEGCPLAALGSDVGRSSSDLRQVFEDGIKVHLQKLREILPETENSDDASFVVLSTLVGALILSRSVSSRTLSQRILDEASRHLISIRTKK